MEKICSVLIPSRRRIERLQETIKRLFDNATNPNAIEVLVRLDRDDLQTYEHIREFSNEWDIKFIIGDRYQGYRDLNKMYGELCKIAVGTFFWLYNDDVDIETVGWDEFLWQYEKKVVIIYPTQIRSTTATGVEVPILHRKIYDLVGHWALTRYNDDWYSELVKGIKEKYSGINVIANKQNICVTHYALPYEHIKDGLPSGIDGIPQMTHKEFILLRNDVNTILEWLDKNPDWKL